MAHIAKAFWWEVPKPTDLKEYAGRFVRVKKDSGEPIVVEIEEVLGSLARPTKLQVNAKGVSYLISALDFYAQMNGESVSDEEIELFDQTTFDISRPNRGRRKWLKRKGLWS